MKKVLYLLAFTLSISLLSCAGDTESRNATGQPVDENTGAAAKAHGEGKEYTSAYICPMHCAGSGSETAGKCPVCNMDYVVLDEHLKDGHHH